MAMLVYGNLQALSALNRLVLFIHSECLSHSRLLELGMEGDVIRTQDLSTVIYSVSRNPIGHFLAWDFVKKHWSELVEK